MKKFFIAGLGLIGGSIAKALKKNCECLIYGLDMDENTISRALADSIIDFGFGNFADIGRKIDCDVVIVATPPNFVVDTVENLAPFFEKDVLFTDVCSIKNDIEGRLENFNFIGGHPMAGTENSGFESSFAELFENAYYILTKENEKLIDLIKIVGAKPIIIPAAKHDFLVGAISHLPHVVSAGLVNLAAKNDGEDGELKKLAGGGFRDITRISSSDELMWQQIIFHNKSNMISLLDDYENLIKKFKDDLENDRFEDITEYFRSARIFRSEFDDKR